MMLHPQCISKTLLLYFTASPAIRLSAEQPQQHGNELAVVSYILVNLSGSKNSCHVKNESI
jgi:hypothetical protein